MTHTPSNDPHTFRIQGKVTIKQGDEIIVECKDNHMVNQGMKGLVSLLGCSAFTHTAGSQYIYTCSDGNTVYLGNDTTTATTAGLSDLVTKLSTVTPVLVTGTEAVAGSTTYWFIRRVAHFAPAAYVGTIGEIGLYMRMPTTMTSKWVQSGAATFPLVLVARFSVGDGDFTSFSFPQNTTLTVEWELGVTS